jgi:valyl-tRNA synthetase
MDLRPQGPEIIRTWLFSTVLRSHLEHYELPWSNVFINGWILDPDRKKMSKSKGNVITPSDLVEQFGADGLRYWACRAGPGADTAIDHATMKNGRRLAIKLLNASKFMLGVTEGGGEEAQPTEVIDRAMLAELCATVEEASQSFAAYDYHQALARTETFVWHFCDDYLELVKSRAYGEGPGAESAKAALSKALGIVLRLLAPFLPFATEEVWSWWKEGSIHRQPWPTVDELSDAAHGDGAVLAMASAVLSEVHKAKTLNQRSLRTEVARLVVADQSDRLDALRVAESDVREAGVVSDLVLRESDEPEITVELAEPV